MNSRFHPLFHPCLIEVLEWHPEISIEVRFDEPLDSLVVTARRESLERVTYLCRLLRDAAINDAAVITVMIFEGLIPADSWLFENSEHWKRGTAKLDKHGTR